MSQTLVQLTGLQGNTIRNATLAALGEDQLRFVHQKSVGGLFPGMTLHSGKIIIVNTGTNDIVVNLAATTTGGTVGLKIGPRGSMELERVSDSDGDAYIYSAAGSTYAVVEE
jgi:hypothetical protein